MSVAALEHPVAHLSIPGQLLRQLARLGLRLCQLPVGAVAVVVVHGVASALAELDQSPLSATHSALRGRLQLTDHAVQSLRRQT